MRRMRVCEGYSFAYHDHVDFKQDRDLLQVSAGMVEDGGIQRKAVLSGNILFCVIADFIVH